ncbi:MAG: ADP-forming succinate--CoA ligase subunit beta, partial [Campylobacter sp.]|nr:ADP-forming succinate--CoA ligase subunit beta [Campylobacter sp.]
NIHEYQAKEICSKFGIKITGGLLASTVDEAVESAKKLGGSVWAVKAQIHAGGRGLGGGVKIAKSIDEVKKYANEILGMTLVSPQTEASGKLVKKIYIEKSCDIKQEFYISFAFDRSSGNIALIASSSGGVSIEEISETSPQLLKTIYIDPVIGLMSFHSIEMANFLKFDIYQTKKFCEVLDKFYQIYITLDAQLVECNPLVLDKADDFIALDAKMSFDDSAIYRQSEISQMRDIDEEEPSEVEAKRYGLSYVKLDGNIGCMVNGAGLAMATMDSIKFEGGNPANFLDVGGGASSQSVAKAFEIILDDKNVKSIFINIFGGIVRCDRIAKGILEATKSVKVKIPIIIRLDGTNADIAKEILKSVNLPNLHVATDLESGAKMAISLAKDLK